MRGYINFDYEKVLKKRKNKTNKLCLLNKDVKNSSGSG
jgi:hypothetical protein